MDPDACLAAALDMSDPWKDERREAAMDLRRWVERGGWLPTAWRDLSRADALTHRHRKIGLMTGLTTIEKLLPELLRGFPAISIFYVFGSTVTGACDGESDVDVAAYIDDRHGQDPLLDLRIGLWLQDRLGCPVDVVIMNNASAILRHEIVRTGRPSCCKACLLPV